MPGKWDEKRPIRPEPSESRVVNRPSYVRIAAALDWLLSQPLPPEVEAEEERIRQLDKAPLAAKKPTLDALPEILTVQDIMSYLDLSRNTVYGLLRSGQIRAVGGNGPDRFCRSWRVSKQSFKDYLGGLGPG